MSEKRNLEEKVAIKTLLVAKAALENARRFVHKHGSEDDASLNHDALYHVEHCLYLLAPPPSQKGE